MVAFQTMKRLNPRRGMKNLILIFLLIAASTSAQIPGRLDSLRVRVFTRLKLPVAGTASTTTAIVWQAINDAQTPVCQDFDAFEKFDTVVIYSVPEGGLLNTDFLRIAGVERTIGDTASPATRYAMQAIEQKDRWEKTGGITGATYDSAQREQPRYYYVHGKRLLTYPKDRRTGTTRDTLLVSYWAEASKLDSVSDTTDIYRDYREALLLKACAAVCRIRQGSQSTEAAAYETLYAVEVNKYGRKK